MRATCPIRLILPDFICLMISQNYIVQLLIYNLYSLQVLKRLKEEHKVLILTGGNKAAYL
jgi:hypothetical protein